MVRGLTCYLGQPLPSRLYIISVSYIFLAARRRYSAPLRSIPRYYQGHFETFLLPLEDLPPPPSPPNPTIFGSRQKHCCRRCRPPCRASPRIQPSDYRNGEGWREGDGTQDMTTINRRLVSSAAVRPLTSCEPIITTAQLCKGRIVFLSAPW